VKKFTHRVASIGCDSSFSLQINSRERSGMYIFKKDDSTVYGADILLLSTYTSKLLTHTTHHENVYLVKEESSMPYIQTTLRFLAYSCAGVAGAGVILIDHAGTHGVRNLAALITIFTAIICMPICAHAVTASEEIAEVCAMAALIALASAVGVQLALVLAGYPLVPAR
jgi:hypothetical protein